MKNTFKLSKHTEEFLACSLFIAIMYFAFPYINILFNFAAQHGDMSINGYMLAKVYNTPPEPTFLTPYIEYMQPFFDVIFYEPFWRVVGFILTCLVGLAFTSVLLAPFSNDTSETKEKLRKEIYESVKKEFESESESKFESKRTSKRKYKRKLNRHR